MKINQRIDLGLLTLAILLATCTFGETRKSAKQALLINSGQPGEEQMSASTNNRISGELMKAFLAAHETFKNDADIPELKRRVENYEIELRQTGDSFIVYFIPKLKAGERPLRGGETELGKEVSYTISKKDYKVTAREFYR
jgi:hypothetical protein